MFSKAAQSFVLFTFTAMAFAAPAVEERAACLNYGRACYDTIPTITCYSQKLVIISTRGTTEAQGPSAGFITMISRTLATVSGGTEYDTVYPAAWDQNSSAATADVRSVSVMGLQQLIVLPDSTPHYPRPYQLPEPKVCTPWLLTGRSRHHRLDEDRDTR
jgi:hypothetical protein